MRTVFARLHRYAGLAIALLLTLSGFTGAVIAFNHELDEWLNPDLFRAEWTGTALSPLGLADRVEASDPRVTVRWLPFGVEPGHSISPWVAPRIDPSTGKPFELGFNQLFVDPTDGTVIGRRLWGQCCLERQHLIPFLYQLHYSLHLPGNLGVWLMGAVGIVWVIDCFVGAYLTFPRGRPLFPGWKTSWKVKRERLNFDLHRAGGLWFWLLLFVLALSSVAMNLGDEVFEPVVDLFSPLTKSAFDTREARPPQQQLPPLQSRAAILSRARDEAAQRGWTDAPMGIFYDAAFGLYGVGFGKEHAPGLGNPWLYFDGDTGKYSGGRIPGEGTAGDLFVQVQFPLHSGQIAGLPGRILIAVTGIVVATLSVTGVLIWLRKWRVSAGYSANAGRRGKAKRDEVAEPRTGKQSSH